ncbi:MAG TPA: hypothetical protein ENK76_03210 [Campylobacterales bacterium]|nr:hypothetical protein [Campylobacterales bacterium]
MKKYIVMILFGLLYIFLIKTDIKTSSNSFIIQSNIPQNANFHIITKYQKSHLICNNKPINIDISKKHDYFYHGEEQITIPLHYGKNICQTQNIEPKIKQKIDFWDFLLLFILLGTPTLYFLLSILIKILDKIKTSNFDINSIATTPINRVIIFIILVGIVVRIAYFNRYGITLFQHDWQGHIDLIKYLTQNYNIPYMPNKGWEFPQQPIYYIISAIIYKLGIYEGSTTNQAIYIVGYFSLFCSSVFLIYSYKLLRLLSSNQWVQAVAMLYISLTPSIVYMSSRINNDVLVMALSPMALFYIIKSYQNSFQKYFYPALITTTLLFLTKISTASIELALFTLLIISYIQTHKNKKELYYFSIVGVFILSWTLWHLYTPLNSSSFYMVNSAKFPKQTIENLDISYFTSFHITDLIKQGYSYVFGVDTIRYSFPTYQYGTMFFGEFDYKYFINKSPYILIVMRSILIFGLIYIIGLFSYLVNIYRENITNKILLAIVIINLILILKFIISYPSICNTDFRYFVSSFTIWGFIFARGLYYLIEKKRWIYISFNIILGGLTLSELMFFYELIH